MKLLKYNANLKKEPLLVQKIVFSRTVTKTLGSQGFLIINTELKKHSLNGI